MLKTRWGRRLPPPFASGTLLVLVVSVLTDTLALGGLGGRCRQLQLARVTLGELEFQLGAVSSLLLPCELPLVLADDVEYGARVGGVHVGAVYAFVQLDLFFGDLDGVVLCGQFLGESFDVKHCCSLCVVATLL